MMKCTDCKKGMLSPRFLDGLFRVDSCTACDGSWILIADYVEWKERNLNYQFFETLKSEVKVSTSALLCPVTGSLMRKFRLSSKNSHRINYSSCVRGVWLAKGEWDFLKREGLAGSLNAVLTVPWQNNIRSVCAREKFTSIYKSKFGNESYSRVSEFREWVDNHPRKSDIHAYLFAKNPYTAPK